MAQLILGHGVSGCFGTIEAIHGHKISSARADSDTGTARKD